jgi:hypothetical protein
MRAPPEARTLSDSRRGGSGAGAARRHAVQMKEEPALEAAEKLARVMDRGYVDPLLGLLLPGAGDVIGAVLGLYPVLLAWRRGAPRGLLARMILNLAVDMLGGAVPIIGDIWDFFFRAHTRNLALLRARLVEGEVRPSARDAFVVAGAILAFLIALAAPIALLWWAIASLVHSS